MPSATATPLAQAKPEHLENSRLAIDSPGVARRDAWCRYIRHQPAAIMLN
ncbi:hypothetical protein [Lacipirellula parvula]|uniref:Uncharacterized protein n=1 Tax=Lacipirellula parvula TaxID=2650471 RepID=A0A5K7X8N5_9BACT|nr:hypothetical protein [Lacipirellula parvula]BBO30793.1 hypothetical protein PLANPX_0405 [Lacipirellula parvula]